MINMHMTLMHIYRIFTARTFEKAEMNFTLRALKDAEMRGNKPKLIFTNQLRSSGAEKNAIAS